MSEPEYWPNLEVLTVAGTPMKEENLAVWLAPRNQRRFPKLREVAGPVGLATLRCLSQFYSESLRALDLSQTILPAALLETCIHIVGSLAELESLTTAAQSTPPPILIAALSRLTKLRTLDMLSCRVKQPVIHPKEVTQRLRQLPSLETFRYVGSEST